MAVVKGRIRNARTKVKAIKLCIKRKNIPGNYLLLLFLPANLILKSKYISTNGKKKPYSFRVEHT